jgi:hemerythrin-like domain-containing protein
MEAEAVLVARNRQIAARSQEEHLRMHVCHERLRAAVLEAEAAYTHLVSGLIDLRTLLDQHIAFEEKDGFMKPVEELRPALSPRVEELRADHVAQKKVLNDLLEALQHPAQSPLPHEDIPRTILGLIDNINCHEEKENNLVLEVFCYDVGTND